ALVFPGQGSVDFKLINELLEFDSKRENLIRPLLNQADEILNDKNFSLNILNNDENSQQFFRRTSNAQPAIFLSSIIIDLFLKNYYHFNIADAVDYFVGHSVGEYISLYFNQILDMENSLKLVQKRGKLMEDIIKNQYDENIEFKMYSLIINPKIFITVYKFLDHYQSNEQVPINERIYISNINSFAQIVIVGPSKLLPSFLNELRSNLKLSKSGFRPFEVPVTIPFHSPYLKNVDVEL
ncbi:FabD/lysophospholipase-like protein, partial [Ascoidea rubescens DSM 1968]